jgi:transaldolase
MANHYFATLHQETGNRFWINNPSEHELRLALDHDAVSCTTNPTYCSKLIGKEPEFLNGFIDKAIEVEDELPAIARRVYRESCVRLSEGFLPRYKSSGGTEGFVTLQDDPTYDEDTNAAIESIKFYRHVGDNYMAKIPVINGGIEAIEFCIEENIPICATEVFAVSQARYMYERYDAACKRTGNRPPFALTHITGIFDEYLQKVVKRESIDIDAETLGYAGLTVARKQYRMMKDAGFDATMLGGGAREMKHFTGLVGGDVHVTINWSTAQEILDTGVSVESRLDEETPQSVIDKLRDKIPEFRMAYDDDGMKPDEFAAYGPVQLFRNAFLKGWHLFLAEIASRKHAFAR